MSGKNDPLLLRIGHIHIQAVDLVTCTMSGHYAPVDDVHIMSCGRMCVSGSRDRTAILWHLDTFLEDDWNHGEPPKSEQLLGHDVSNGSKTSFSTISV